jgi:hypothetical protein
MVHGQRLTLRRAYRVVGSVELLLDGGAGPVGRFLERDGDGGLLGFAAQVTEVLSEMLSAHGRPAVPQDYCVNCQ